MARAGTVTSDVGINRVDGKLVSDVDSESAHLWCPPLLGALAP